MGGVLKDPSKSQCTGFVIPGEEMGMGYSAQIEYVQKLLCDPQYQEEGVKENQTYVTYTTKDPVSCFRIQKEGKGGMTIFPFESSPFKVALQKSGKLPLTVYPVEEERSLIKLKRMEKLHV